LRRVARNDVERLAKTPNIVIARSACDEAIQFFYGVQAVFGSILVDQRF
jgi:hypothetical protein